MMDNLDCIIVANGLFPEDDKIVNLLRKDDIYIIACDGGVGNLAERNIIPDIIIGDLDSIDPELKQRFSDIVIRNKEQETNDLTKAVNYAVSKGFNDIGIIAATGLREDHTLGNISLLTAYKELVYNICIISDFGYFVSINKTTEFRAIPGQQISVFSLPPLSPITSEGLLYPIDNRNFPIWWEGTLNQSISDKFTLYVDGVNANIIVYFSFTVK